MILYTGEPMHDPDRHAGCWGDRDGQECGDPPVNLGLCGDCLARLGGDRSVGRRPPCCRRVTDPRRGGVTHRWVRRAELWLWDGTPAWMPDVAERLSLRALCLIAGHRAIDDQCGRPEHRACYRCNMSMPYAPT